MAFYIIGLPALLCHYSVYHKVGVRMLVNTREPIEAILFTLLGSKVIFQAHSLICLNLKNITSGKNKYIARQP